MSGPCGICRRDPAAGLASMWTPEGGQVWLCHGDEDDSPTCYEQVPALSAAVRDGMRVALMWPLDPEVFGISPPSP